MPAIDGLVGEHGPLYILNLTTLTRLLPLIIFDNSSCDS